MVQVLASKKSKSGSILKLMEQNLLLIVTVVGVVGGFYLVLNASRGESQTIAPDSSTGIRSGSGSGSGSGSRSVGPNGVDEDAIVLMFDNIADEDDPYVAGMEGISMLCDDLGIDALEDIRVLVLLWKLGANEKPAQISKEEWKKGCIELRVDSMAKFKALLPALDTGFLDRTEFKDFFKFCFQFNRQGTHRTLDKDLVTALIPMTLKDRVPSKRLSTFCDFLTESKDESYSRITLDQWTSFLDFCYEVEDIADYDEDTSAWPVLIDEYVEYLEELEKK